MKKRKTKQMKRRPRLATKLAKISIRLDERTRRALEREADRSGLKISRVVESALRDYLGLS